MVRIFGCTEKSSIIFCFPWFQTALGIIQGACWTHSKRFCAYFLECFSLILTPGVVDDMIAYILPLFMHRSEYIVLFALWVFWIFDFNSVSIFRATDFHKGGVLSYSRWGPQITSWCAVTTLEYTECCILEITSLFLLVVRSTVCSTYLYRDVGNYIGASY